MTNVVMDTHGIIYLAGQQFQPSNGSRITLNTGSIIAGYLLPDGGSLSLTGKVDNSSTMERQLVKAVAGKGPPYLMR